MSCNDALMVSLSIAQPGDESLFWIEPCPLGYFISGRQIVVTNGQAVDRPLTEAQLTRPSKVRHRYQGGEVYMVNLIFDPGGATGRSAEVHAELVRGGAVVHSWCTTVRSGTPDPDFTIYGIKEP